MENKYDEALAKARAGKPLEEIFPELKESEDERIRKEINTLYSDIDDCITELLKARTNKDSEAEGKALFKMEGLMVGTLQDLSCITDYLEKQKDKNRAQERYHRMAPIYNNKESFESALEKAWKYYNESASRKVDSFEDDYIECVFSKGFREGFLYKEKQKEQKQIAEEVLIKAGLKTFRDGNQWCILVGDNIQEGICGFGDTIEDALYAFLLEILNLQKEQKPVEGDFPYNEPADSLEGEIDNIWGKLSIQNKFTATKEGFREVILHFVNYVKGQIPIFKVGDTLRKKGKDYTFVVNRIQGGYYLTANDSFFPIEEQDKWELVEQKPAEWSEEDEKMIQSLILEIDKYVFFAGIESKQIINFLKSLRPQQNFVPRTDDIVPLKVAIKILKERSDIKYVNVASKLKDLLNKLEHGNPVNWKPSEEQMNALYDILNPADPVNLDAVKSLFNDLKKLI